MSKLCIDCKHFHSQGEPFYNFAKCFNKKAFPVNMVTGQDGQKYKDPYDLRADAKLCGSEGRYFELKEITE